jgi:hypothetical protein
MVKEFFASLTGRGRDKACSGGARGGGANRGWQKLGRRCGLQTEVAWLCGQASAVREIGLVGRLIHPGPSTIHMGWDKNPFSFIHFSSNKFQSSGLKKQITILLNSKTFQIWQVDR